MDDCGKNEPGKIEAMLLLHMLRDGGRIRTRPGTLAHECFSDLAAKGLVKRIGGTLDAEGFATYRLIASKRRAPQVFPHFAGRSQAKAGGS